MFKKCTIAAVFLSSLVFINSAGAVSWDIGEVRFGINAYMDLEYTYMEGMPMLGTNAAGKTMIMPMAKSSSFDQHHMNLIIDAARERFNLHLNLSSEHAYSTEESVGEWGMLEVYGGYKVNNGLKLKAGHILSPFGIYNEIKFMTPMFAPVVLPFIYEINNYSGGSLVPDHSNITVSGAQFTDSFDINYAFYIGNGETDSNGKDENMEKQMGSRVMISLMEQYSLGFSFFTNIDSQSEGRRNTFAGDIDFAITESLNFKSEYLFDSYEEKNRKDRTAFYARLTYETEKFIPFIEYNYFADYGDMLYRHGILRSSAGIGYNFNENMILKAEYHYHKFHKSDDFPDNTDAFSMVKTSAIFSF